jgi:hypothetical protein
VIIPAFNAASSLSACIRSTLAQTLRPSEIIVVDDGSQDGTAEVVREFTEPVRFVRQEHAGVAVARNRGIAQARGELIAFLDADDYWRPNHLRNAAELFTAHPDLRWVSCSYERRARWGRAIRSAPNPQVLQEGTRGDYFEMLDSWTNYTPTMVLQRTLFDEVGVFDPEMPTGEDLHLWFRIALRYPQIGYSHEISVIIQDTEGSLVTQELLTLEKASRFVEKCKLEAARLGLDEDPRIRRCLVRWSLPVMRRALLSGDKNALLWMRSHFRRDIPVRWRFLSRACEWTPAPLWAVLARIWERVRPVRLRIAGSPLRS